MKFVVAHAGARRGYAVPSILEKAGMLEHFYTDFCADVGLGRILANSRVQLKSLQLLRSRRLPENIVSKTRTFWKPDASHLLQRLRYRQNPDAAFRSELQWQCKLGKDMARCGFGEAKWLHSFIDEFPTLITAAKERGLGVVSEIYILLSSDRLIAEERRRFPGLEAQTPDIIGVMNEMLGEHVVVSRSDYALCPSEAVRQDLIENFCYSPDRAIVVPYGVNEDWLLRESTAIPRRVLFVGSADLRKGIHYLAMAAEKIKPRNPAYEFRIAGNVTPNIAGHSMFKHLTFLGRVPRDEVAREFATADVLVLPTLAEGSAAVTYEALASCVPVVTTQASGSVVRDGIDGRIVPERDPASLSSAILEIAGDRSKRETMSRSAKERARDYTWDRYGERLVNALQKIATK